nr:uncharacterized protein LOC111419131 [Onthophagus taurus]
MANNAMYHINVLQANVNRSTEAMNLVELYVSEQSVDVVMLSEPNKNKVKCGNWYKNSDSDVAVKIISDDLVVYGTVSGSGFVIVKMDFVDIIGCYLTPNEPLCDFKNKLENIASIMQQNKTKNIIVMGDFNSKSAAWGSHVEDERGRYLKEWMAERNLVVMNSGTTPTWRRGEQKSFIDITMCNVEIAKSVTAWKVNLSDHLYITFKVEIGRGKGGQRQAGRERWHIRDDKKEAYIRDFQRRLNHREAIDPEWLENATIKACDKAYGKKKPSKNKKGAVYWWNKDTKEARERANRCRRSMTRIYARKGEEGERNEAERRYKEAKKK